DCDVAAIVIRKRMVEKCDRLAAGVDTRMTDPSDGVVQNFADRILEPAATVDRPDDRERSAIRRPVRRFNVFEQQPRRAARDWYLCKRPAVAQISDRMRADRDRELSRR